MRRILRHLLAWQFVVGIALSISFGLNDLRVVAGLGFAIHAAVCALLIRLNWLLFARISIPLFWFGICTLLCITGHGIHDISMSVFPLAIVAASILMGRRGLVVCWAAALTCMFVMVWGEITQNLPMEVSGDTTYADFGYLAVAYTALTMTLWVATGYWRALLEGSRSHERELAQSEARFRAIADHTFNWENWIDADGTVRWMSPSVECVSGYTAHECLEMDDLPGTLVHEDDLDRALDIRKRAYRGESGEGEELRMRRKDGSIRWVSIAWRPIFNADGKSAGFRSSIQDITERRRAEEKQAELEEQLHQSQRLEAVGKLAGGVAHDFNNLLLAIRGNVELLLENPDLSEGDRGLALEATAAADRAAKLTNQLLAFSRRQVMKPEPTDINELLSDLTGMLKRLIPEAIAFRFEPMANPAVVDGDRGHLEQIIVNLVVNARDAMPAGGELTVETGNATNVETLPPGECVVIRVSDTGEGMTDDVRERIFEPFFTTKPTGKGTGLGLSTVFGLIQQHRGVAHVESEPGKGTTFEICLPASTEAVSKPTSAKRLRDHTGTETILVVEDEPAVLNLACTILESAGYKTIRCENGQEATQCYAARSGEIDLVLSDVVMPVMGGREVLRRLREMDPAVRFLFSSGYTGDPEHTDFILDEGFNFLPKPYTPGELLERVRTALDAAGKSGLSQTA